SLAAGAGDVDAQVADWRERLPRAGAGKLSESKPVRRRARLAQRLAAEGSERAASADLPVSAPRDALTAAARRGSIERRPGGELGRSSGAAPAPCPAGPSGTRFCRTRPSAGAAA